MDLTQLIQMLRSSQNPQQMVLNMVQKNVGDNPIFANLLNMAQNNDGKGIEEVARNMFKERGLDFDKEFNNFKKTIGL